jgi:hypothetical protein
MAESEHSGRAGIMRGIALGICFFPILWTTARAQEITPQMFEECNLKWKQHRAESGVAVEPSSVTSEFFANCYREKFGVRMPVPKSKIESPKIAVVPDSNGPHPNNVDATQCVATFINKSVSMGPVVLQCSNSVRFEGAKVIDTKPNGGNTDAIVEITLRVVTNLGGQSMAATMCTGSGWGGDLVPGQRLVMTKVMSFQVFPTQAICLTNSIEPIVRGNSFNN